MKKLPLILFGPGKVGTEFLKQLSGAQAYIRKRYKVSVDVLQIYDSAHKPKDALKLLKSMTSPFVLIDTTASADMGPYIELALASGGYVVMSNKKPMTGDAPLNHSRVFFETTVGAGLPIISTIQELLDSGDEVLSITGCFSGTLGFIFSELENGRSFSEAVKIAKSKGYTEPDPRDDLSGTDVVRKALILSRLIGLNVKLSDIPVESLYPAAYKKLSIDDFMKKISDLDTAFHKKFTTAQKKDATLRYVATITPKGAKVGVKTVPKNSDIGNLSGPDNIVVIETKRYNEHPMIIKGPGAGVSVTAAGVLGDVLKIVKHTA